MRLSSITKGMICKVELKGMNENKECFIVRGDILEIDKSFSLGKDLKFVAFENEYDKDLNHIDDNKLDIMKIWSSTGELIFNRTVKENKTDWSKVKLGEMVEYFNGKEWKKAQFVFYYPMGGSILMRDEKELICNHTEKTVRLVKNTKDTKPFECNENIDDVLEEVMGAMLSIFSPQNR